MNQNILMIDQRIFNDHFFITFSCLQSTLVYPNGVYLSTACLYKYGRNSQGAHIMKIDLVLDITM